MLDTLIYFFPKARRARLWAALTDLALAALLLWLCGFLTGRPDFAGTSAAFQELSSFQGSTEELQELVLQCALRFQEVFAFSLWMFFGYEFLFTALLGGRTPGKALFGLVIEPLRNGERRLLTVWKLAARSAVKCLSVYLFQGFPFLISLLYLFSDGENRTGYDRIARVRVRLCAERAILPFCAQRKEPSL